MHRTERQHELLLLSDLAVVADPQFEQLLEVEESEPPRLVVTRLVPGSLLEESAALIRAYQPQVVPGLLQTEAYVRAITAASFPAENAEDSERRVALRLARQDLLKRPAPPEYWVVLEETVLRRPIGGPQVMRGQIEHLIECAARPDVTIQVLPFAAGWHPAMYGMFNIFRFPDDTLPDVVYSEALTSAYYLNKPEETTQYTEALDRMGAQAATPDQTVTILRQILKEH